MATVKQKRLAQLIIENATLDKPLTGGQMLEKASYSKGMQIQPSRVIEREGVKEALNDFGFSEDNAKRVVAEILLKEEARDSDRLKAADMVFDVHGSKAPTKSINLNVEAEIDLELEELTHKLNDVYKGTSLASNGESSRIVGSEVQDKE